MGFPELDLSPKPEIGPAMGPNHNWSGKGFEGRSFLFSTATLLVAGFHFLTFREVEVSVDARFCDWQLVARPQ